MPFVREIIVCKTPQTGVSEAAHNFVGYCVERAPRVACCVLDDKRFATKRRDDGKDMAKSDKRFARKGTN